MAPLVLLDRDGVINEDSRHYIRRPSDWRSIPGSLEAIARFNAAGWQVGVCTNQSGLTRGLIRPEDLDAIHGLLRQELAAVGGWLDGIFVCPHTANEGCRCRKPEPGLINDACHELDHSPHNVPFIGDSPRDLEAARRAGAIPMLVRTGNGRRTQGEGIGRVAAFDDLKAASEAILKEATRFAEPKDAE